MAWIESHQKTKDHPKMLNLMSLMGWDLDTTIGKLHRFWWWCLDFAEDGDLTRYNHAQLAAVVSVPQNSAEKFVSAMITCGGDNSPGFFETEPYFRVHDWWDYIGKFLMIKYKNRPLKWKKVYRSYNSSKNRSKRSPKNRSQNTTPNQPNLPNQPNQPLVKISASSVVAKKPNGSKPLTDVQKVVEAWKILNGIPRDDKSWDRVHYPRYTKSAKALVDLFGNYKDAVGCVEWLTDYFKQKKLSCTIETIVKHSDMYREVLAGRGP